ncbi:MAG: class I SAM-dependent methyltransferase [Candidatus Harrisonbacteria bacterium]|nr:class I SAM-dependent methyltransferase [Candidatus Harrisonbacteria bacterium]
MPIDRSIVTKKDIGEGYDAIAEKMRLPEEFYNEVLDIEPDWHGDILEAGVGQGVVLKNIQKRGGRNIRSLTGIDLSERLIAMAKSLVPEAKILKADIEQMPFPDNSFDFVVMVDVFPYLLDFDKALEEVRRVLRPSGIFIVTVPNKNWILFDRYIKARKNIQPVDDRFFDFEEMKELLERNGFAVADYKGADALRFYGWKHKLDRLAAFFLSFLHKRMKKIVFRAIKR